ncbi:hypothetical protein ACPOL_5464 [Acidisarcina polymorpha]|uniref:Uncharacterized protein n=2 Tax=Acidisarcina polymorpha TaxID=2211140 RepID=A0A2Z5G662_9BACT|nr:hypothetical protein ACPOL_5464 [Acidisarcina polymorpha]
MRLKWEQWRRSKDWSELLVAGVSMQNRVFFAVGLLMASVVAVLIPAHAQNASQPPPASSQSDAGNTSAANKDQSKTHPDSKTPPEAPAPKKKATTAEDNPFPEDVSKQAAAAAAADAKSAATPDAPAPTAPGSTSGTEANGSSSRDNIDKLGLDDPARKQLKLESPDGSSDVYDQKRATEDVRVGQFYLKTGDFKGAYARFKDATSFNHEDAEAVFWLAEAARKMNLPQEAEQNYEIYLEAVPDGPNAKTARKALAELISSKKP